MLYHFNFFTIMSKPLPWPLVIIISCESLLFVETLERPRPAAKLTIEISNVATTYETFQSRCHAPPNIQDTNVSDQMTDKMRQSGLPSLWLPIKRISLGGWYWLNGQFFGTHISKSTTFIPGLDCAVLRSRKSWIDDVDCATIYPYYLCNTGERLQAVNDSGQIIELSGSKYVLKHQNVTWYEAKQSCHMEGYELASFPNQQLENTTRKLKAVLGNKNSWIGLRRSDYFFQKNGSQDEVVFQRWNQKSLCMCPEKDCAVLKIGKSGGYWEPENCNASHSFACLVPIESTGNEEKNRWVIIGVSVGGATSLMLIVTVTVAVLCWLRPRKHENQEPGEDQNDRTDSKLLKEMPNVSRKPPHSTAKKLVVKETKTSKKRKHLGREKRNARPNNHGGMV